VRARTTLWAAVVVLGAGATAGCGAGSGATGTPKVDAKQVEGLLVERQRERDPALRASSATCPSGVEARQGESFRCSVMVEGQSAQFTVTISEVLGTTAHYDIQPIYAIVDVQQVSDFLRSRLELDWRSAQIDCGQARVRIVDVGTAIACNVSNGATTRHVDAVVEDLDGTVSFQEH
jgi:hypothetical protein